MPEKFDFLDFEIRMAALSLASNAVSYQFPDSLQEIVFESMYVDVLTDATVANRFPNLQHFSRTGNVVAVSAVPNAVTASNNAVMSFCPGGSGVGNATTNIYELAFNGSLRPLDTLTLNCSGAQAGDTWTVIMRYRGLPRVLD